MMSRAGLAESAVLLLFTGVVATLGAWRLYGAAAARRSYVWQGSFESGAGDWRLPPGAEVEEIPDAPHGSRSLRITGGTAFQEVHDLKPGTRLTLAASYRLEEVHPTAERGYAFLAVYQLDRFGDLVHFYDFVQATGTAPWRRASYTFEVAPEATTVSIRAGLFQAEGTLWVDAFTLVEGDWPAEFDPAGEVEESIAQVPGLRYSERGNIAIYRDTIPSSGAASSPETLAAALKDAGFGVAFLNSDQLADPATLNRATFDVLVLPYGASFPVKAADNFRRFLRRGGKFLSTGGYAFDNLLERRNGRWEKPAVAAPPDVEDARWRYAFSAKELRARGGTFTFVGRMRTLNVRGEGFAFLAVYQFGRKGEIVAWKDVCHLTGSQAWNEYRYPFEVHPQAERVEVQAGLYRCHGVAWAEALHLIDDARNALRPPEITTAESGWKPTPADRCAVDPVGGSD
ncbi:MAG: hypothetical protein QHJ73_11390, partial [Armatimonadota bacterium]|nr:hypothetical protein [Armatimonadota bacterium]